MSKETDSEDTDSNRRKVRVTVRDDLMNKCRWVCAICWALERDGRRKEGQLAHINRKRHDNRPSNLCWLCLFCHNRYDTNMNQSGNFTLGELKKYKKEVEAEVSKGRLPTNESRFAGALLGVTILEANVFRLRADAEPGLEVRVMCTNQGESPTCVEAVALAETSCITGNLDTHGERRPDGRIAVGWHHPDSEVFCFGASQAVSPGALTLWSIRFINLRDPGNLLSPLIPNADRDDFSPPHPLPEPIQLVVRPVVGASVLAEISEVHVTRAWLEEASHIEYQLNRDCYRTIADYHYEQRLHREKLQAIKRPFPNLEGSLIPSVLYRNLKPL